jgi:hypothetical protein
MQTNENFSDLTIAKSFVYYQEGGLAAAGKTTKKSPIQVPILQIFGFPLYILRVESFLRVPQEPPQKASRLVLPPHQPF